MEKAADTKAEEEALVLLRDSALKEQFVRGVKEHSVRHELRRIALGSADRSFLVMRDEVLSLLGDHSESQRTVRVRGAEAEPDSVNQVIMQVMQTQQQLQSQMMQLASQQCQTASQLQAILDKLPGLIGQPQFALPAPVMRDRQSRRNPQDGLCFFCKEQGHFIRECPKKKLADSRRGQEQDHMQGSARLAGMVALENVGTYVRIVGVNGLDVPFEGCLEVPITIFGQTIMVSFFVKCDATGSGVKRKYPVILG
jgi:hypothetical protein